MYEDMNFPLMTSIFCSSLLQGVFRRRFQPSIQLLYPSYSSILFKKSSTSSKFSKKSSGSSLLFVGRGGASWSGLQVCVLLYIFFLFLCELSKERSEAAVLHQLISIITSFWWRQGVQIVERARERQEGTEKNEDHEDKTSSLSPNHFSGLIFPNLISLSCWDLTRREIGKCKKLQKLTYLISCAHRTKKKWFPGYTPEFSGHGHRTPVRSRTRTKSKVRIKAPESDFLTRTWTIFLRVRKVLVHPNGDVFKTRNDA